MRDIRTIDLNLLRALDALLDEVVAVRVVRFPELGERIARVDRQHEHQQRSEDEDHQGDTQTSRDVSDH